jgi:hypothetical protein
MVKGFSLNTYKGHVGGQPSQKRKGASQPSLLCTSHRLTFISYVAATGVVDTEIHWDPKNRCQQSSQVVPTNKTHLEAPAEPPVSESHVARHADNNSSATSLPFFQQLETLGAEALSQLLNMLSHTSCPNDPLASNKDIQSSKSQYRLVLDAALKKVGIKKEQSASTPGKSRRKKCAVTHSVTVSPHVYQY